MPKELRVEAGVRAKAGTGEARRLRRKGMIPAVVYNEKAEARPIQLNAHDFGRLLKGHGSGSVLLTLALDGEEKKVLIREMQRHPVTDTILHVDFLEVSMTRKMRVEVPVRLVGEPVGVTTGGGVLQHLLRSVTIECLPGDLVEEIVADVSALQVGQSLMAGDIPLPSSLALVTAKDVAVATVTEQREEEVAAAPAEAAEATAEPELVGKKKEKEGEAEAEAGEAKEAAPSKEKESGEKKESKK